MKFKRDQAQAVSDGIEKGREQGREQARKEAALALKNNGISPELIQKATGLSLELIEEL